MIFARMVATGSFLPQQKVSNTDLAQRIDTSDEWITQRTGIRSRHIAAAQDTTASMAIAASKQALARAGWLPQDVDLIIVATCTPDQMFPATACLIQQALTIPACIAFDVSAACSGFIYALNIATQFIESGQCQRALLVGSEVMSRVLDWQDRATCVLFGDGAGAVLLAAGTEPGVLATSLCADGKYKDLLYLNNNFVAVNVPVNSQANSQANFQASASANITHCDPYLRMHGNQVFKLAVKALGDIAVSIIAKAQLTAQDIDWIIPHQANLRIIQATSKKLGIDMDKVVVTVAEHANTSAASIPLALDVAVTDGRVKVGDNILLEAFGGGLTWGAALVKFG